MSTIQISAGLLAAYPGAHIGILTMLEVQNPVEHALLNFRKAELERQLREKYGSINRSELKEIYPLNVYAGYYKQFKKTYHVLLQLESIVYKDKSIPRVAALVEASFMAEIESLLLTAGHDLQSLEPPIVFDVANGDETYTLLSGEPKTLKAGDTYMRDARGAACSIIYGSDARTRITTHTRQVMFVVYAPPGIRTDSIQQHLAAIQEYVHMITPSAVTRELEVIPLSA